MRGEAGRILAVLSNQCSQRLNPDPCDVSSGGGAGGDVCARDSKIPAGLQGESNWLDFGILSWPSTFGGGGGAGWHQSSTCPLAPGVGGCCLISMAMILLLLLFFFSFPTFSGINTSSSPRRRPSRGMHGHASWPSRPHGPSSESTIAVRADPRARVDRRSASRALLLLLRQEPISLSLSLRAVERHRRAPRTRACASPPPLPVSPSLFATASSGDKNGLKGSAH